jgi:hypothetical protein
MTKSLRWNCQTAGFLFLEDVTRRAAVSFQSHCFLWQPLWNGIPPRAPGLRTRAHDAPNLKQELL